MAIANMRRSASWLAQVFVLAAAALIAVPASAANYPLELVSPRAVGTAPAAGNAAITSTHRIFKAYPGLEYNIRAVVIGGAYPYRFALSNAPAGMTIDEDTGTIVWPNPQANATPTISVTDSEGTRASSNWAIEVTTTGFNFIDAVNGRSGAAGTVTDPWRRISDMVNSANAGPGDIVYFRAGTYDALDLPRQGVGGPWENVDINGTRKPVIWLAYPGTRPVINFGFQPGVENGPLIRFDGSNVYVDGFETRNSRIMGFQLTSSPPSHYRVMRRLRMHDHNLIRADLDGTNASFIMTTSSYSDSSTGGSASTWAQYLAIQDCEFYNAPVDMALKSYSNWKMLFENNVLHDMYIGVEIKADMPRFTYRANRHYAITGRPVGGNLHATSTNGEILFNLIDAPSAGLSALDINQDGLAKRIDIYRNTILGRVRVRNTDGSDGPFRFYNNVIVNDDVGTPVGSHIYYEGVTDPTRISGIDNLAGYDSANIVDSAGALAGTYVQFLGTRGYQINADASTTSPPSPPEDIVVQ